MTQEQVCVFSDLDVTAYIDQDPDDGCTAATDFLQRKTKLPIMSHCKDCPSAKCIDDLTPHERKALKNYRRKGILEFDIIELVDIAPYVYSPRDNARV